MVREYDLFTYFPIHIDDFMFVLEHRMFRVELETELGTRTFDINLN